MLPLIIGAITCTPCEAGSYQDGVLGTKCTLCAPGMDIWHYSSTSSSNYSYTQIIYVRASSPSWYVLGGESVRCIGTSQQGSGQTQCLPCASGQVAPQSGQSICTPCTGGLDADVTRTTCKCPLGIHYLTYIHTYICLVFSE